MIRSRTKTHLLRGMGGLIAAMAVLPWLAGTSAQAASSTPGDCSTAPSGVSPSAMCAPLLGPNGKTVFGETWTWRNGGNTLKVATYPIDPVGTGTPVTLCVTSAAPYPAKHQCNVGDQDNVYAGAATFITFALDTVGISASDPVYYTLSVLQGSTTANSSGNGGAAPSPSPSASPTKTSASPSPSHSHSPSPSPTKTSASPSPSHSHSPSPSPTDTSASPSATQTSQTPSASVSASSTHSTDGASPATSVLGVKLAHTGASGEAGALMLSVGLLAVGGILVAVGQTTRPSRRH